MWFLNAMMLLGLAGVTLPVLAHLLSKKRYEVVRWGAMQFLELGRNTQRRVRLEEFLLLFVRMGIIALIALALARPWVTSRWFAGYSSSESRDVVLVLDGSTSMGWEGKTTTPHGAAIQTSHRFLEQLRGGDTVALLDVRDVVRPVLTPGSTDFRSARQALNGLPPPLGGSDLVEATSQALRILNTSGNLTRDVLIFTDLQARGWNLEDPQRWDFIDEQRKQPAIAPHIWVVDVSGQTVPAVRENFSLDRIKLSREFTAIDMSVRIQTKLRHHGGQGAASRKIYLEVDGQRLGGSTVQSTSLPPGGEFSVEFDHVFTTPGGHLVSVVTDPDQLPGDDRADAALEVTPSLPVIIVDGAPHPDPTKAESFFIKSALGDGSSRMTLIKPQVIPLEQLQAETLKAAQLLVLANVPQLTPQQVSAVQTFVDGGGGLWLALGDRVNLASYNEALFAKGKGLLPSTLEKIEQPPKPMGGQESVPIHVENGSLDLPWTQPFRKEHQGGFTETRFDKWWRVTPSQAGPEELAAGLRSASVAARLTNGAPLLVEREYGHGRVLLMTAPLDSDWSTFPAKLDYVPFLHEVLFHLAPGSRTSRNISSGEPLLLPVTSHFDPTTHVFKGPGKLVFPVTMGGDELRPFAKLDDTSIPGIYTLVPTKNGQPIAGSPGDPCVVNYDRRESDLTMLTKEQRDFLEAGERLKIVNSLDELRRQMFKGQTRFEFWQILLLFMLGMLVFEVWMTRRLVQGGHAVLDQN